MPALHFRQVAKQLPYGRVGHPFLSALVELPRLQFHDLGLFPHRVDAQRPYQPNRPPGDEALYVVAADQRDVLSEALPVHLDQAAAMLGLLCLHLLEHLRRSRVGLAQTVHEVAIDAAVLLLQRNGQRQDLPLGQVFEVLRHACSPMGRTDRDTIRPTDTTSDRTTKPHEVRTGRHS